MSDQIARFLVIFVYLPCAILFYNFLLGPLLLDFLSFLGPRLTEQLPDLIANQLESQLDGLLGSLVVALTMLFVNLFSFLLWGLAQLFTILCPLFFIIIKPTYVFLKSPLIFKNFIKNFSKGGNREEESDPGEEEANPIPRQPPRRSNREEEADPVPHQPPRRRNREEDANPIPRQVPGRSNREEEANPVPDPSKLIEILSSLFEIGGYLARNISTSQEKVVQDMMNKMKLEGDQKQLALHFYNEGKKATEKKILTLTSNLKDNHQKAPEILNIFMVILMEFIYLLDASMINSINNIIKTISTKLELEEITFDSIIELTRVRSKNIKELELPIVYKIIGISNPTVNPKMIKKVARNLRKTYHPDALINKGLPQEMLVFGTQLSQAFNSIYENHIKKL